MEGVRAAMVLQPGATSSLDLEKRDRKMAKVVIDIVGLEPEKYRLGYTKVKGEGVIASTQPRSPKCFIYCLISAVAVVFFWSPLKTPLPLPFIRHLAIFTSPLPSYFFFRCFSAPAFSE